MNMRGIKTKGQFIIDSTNFDLLWGKKKNSDGKETFEEKKYSIVFGRNGSGKTTIAKAVSDYKNGITETFETHFYDSAMNEIFPDKDNIYVFSESFVNDNVMVAEDGKLNAIVLFGKATDIDKEIERLNAKVKDNLESKKLEDIERFHRSGDKDNIEKALSDINDELRNHWSSREQEIKNLKRKASVDSETVASICEAKKPTETKNVLEKSLSELLTNIKKVRSVGSAVDLISIDVDINSLDYYNGLATTSFSKDQMSEFALDVLSLVEKTSSKYLNDSKDILTNGGRCPLCFQQIDKTYGNNTLRIINSLFDEKIEIEKSKIQSSLLQTLDTPDFNRYEGIIPHELISNLNKEIAEYNELCRKINDALQAKIDAIYSPLSKIDVDIELRKKSLKNAINSINNAIDKFNSDVRDKENNMDKARLVNLSIAYYECLNLVERYHSLKKEEKNSIDKINALENENKEAESKIAELNARKKNYSIALSEINKCLACIFSSNSRLRLQPSDDPSKYYVLSKGKRVKAKKLSTGERNAISLVYYYEQLKQNCVEGEYFKNEGIYVIDDPISSFDYENKLGMLSFIKKILSEIKTGNKNSKIIVMTHEMEIASYIDRIMADLNMSSESCCLELSGTGVKIINSSKYTQYGTLMNCVFEYGENPDPEKDIFIGNAIRRLLEAYSSFNYKETMDKFLSKADYIGKIKDKSLREYFSFRMNRLVLNERSHSENVIRQIPNSMNFDSFPSEENAQTARDIIALLYFLDKTHVTRYLPMEKEKVVLRWIEDIEKQQQ